MPTDCSALAAVVAREHGNIHRSNSFGADAVLRLLERCDALRRPQRFADALLACACDARGRTGLEDQAYPQRARLAAALAAALAAPVQAVAEAAAAAGLQGPAIGAQVRAARLAAVAAALGPG